ncbi:hypothetical protein GGX14DRAFT_347718 [Mycena pura]|uniref:Uncharacterized protein n=1 Tax=Mycena pura TaxID=153505 RepID=A0AAD6YR62_9AGAR|nr:hypothetical protein GGX14DRAFT_347718 [Mycena pura]
MATGTHDQANAEIILALSKMGIYMERDREKLDTLSPSAQNTRLRKALDRAVDNCCIFQLLFTKEHREMGKLVLSALPEWEGWRVPRGEIVARELGRRPVKDMDVLHFVDRPNSFGILLLKQTGIVGTTRVLSSLGSPLTNVDNTEIFEAVVNIIKKSNKKDKAEAAYFWATRKGDCIEVDLEDLPDQSLGW